MSSSDILFHQSIVDYADSSGGLYHTAWIEDGSDLTAVTETEAAALDAFEHVVDLKTLAGTLPDRTYDLASQNHNTETIPLKRRGAFLLAERLAAKAAMTGAEVSWYGLADVHDYSVSGAALDHVNVARNSRGEIMYIRLEEALVLRAERLAAALKTNNSRKPVTHQIDGDTLLVKRSNGGTRAVPLHGYEFNRTGSLANAPKQSIGGLPSCELFIAATALEQAALVPAVVRVIPYWMKDREIMARDIVRSLGYTTLPILSVVASEQGDVQKKFNWGGNLPDDLRRLEPIINEHTAHRTSTQVAKQIHDSVFASHRKLYEQFCRPELASNITPSTLLGYQYLTARAHEFLSRTLPAAPLYEEFKVTADNAAAVLQNIATLHQLMNKNYQQKSLMQSKPACEIMRYEGSNTYKVTYIKMVIASRPEEDPVALTYSNQIDLIGHFVFENLPDSLVAQYRHGRCDSDDLMQQFLAHPPRSVLIEASRHGLSPE